MLFFVSCLFIATFVILIFQLPSALTCERVLVILVRQSVTQAFCNKYTYLWSSIAFSSCQITIICTVLYTTPNNWDCPVVYLFKSFLYGVDICQFYKVFDLTATLPNNGTATSLKNQNVGLYNKKYIIRSHTHTYTQYAHMQTHVFRSF